MHRRRLLSLCGAGLVGLAGCAGETPGGGTDTPTPTADTAVAVERARALPWLVALNTPDSIAVGGDDDERYVLVTVNATDADEPPAREAFTLSVGEETHTPTTDLGFGGSLDSYHFLGPSVYDAERPSGDLPFAVPERESAPTVALTWPGFDDERSLEGAGEVLARHDPSFEVESFGAESDDAGEATLSATVHNTGDARGWFVGALNRTGPSTAYTPVTGTAFEVGAGETETWTHVDDSVGSSGTATYRFRTASERRQASVEVG